MKIAIDAQILMKNHARRMVIGAAECASVSVVLPETAATMAKLHYHRVAERYVEKVVVWSAEAAQETLDEEAMGLRIQDKLDKVTDGFAHWLDEEQRRNDGIFERAPRTRRTQGVARELSLHGVVGDPKDTRWELGEDPYVIAEALEAGAHWIASDNFRTLSEDAMEDWLDGVGREGRYEHVPRPFILSGQKALDTMLARVEGWSPEPEERALRRIALAHALSEPNDETTGITRRVAILGRFAKDLQDCAMSVPGKNLEHWQIRMYARLEDGKENRVWDEIERLRRIRPTGDVRRTREAEDRRIQWERGQGSEHRPASSLGGIGR